MTEDDIREREIRQGIEAAKANERLYDMIQRYAAYGTPIDVPGYITGEA